MAGKEQRVLRNYALLQASGITSSIVNPTVKANSFELSPRSLPSWSETGLVDIPWTTPMHIFAGSFRNTTPLNSTGCPLMRFGCDSSHSHWRIKPVTGCRMKSLTHSLLGRLFQRRSSANTSWLEKLQSWEPTSPPSIRGMGSPCARHERGSRSSSGSAPTMMFLTGC